MENKLVTIIVPVYNTGRMVCDCLDSILNQTYTNLEILCINDNSTDDSIVYLKNYAAKDTRIKIIDRDKNYGLSITRNLGIQEASGDFICFVDSDDLISRDFIMDLLLDIEKTNSDIAIGSIYKIFGTTKLIEAFLIYNKNEEAICTKKKFDLAKLPEYNYVWNKLYKAKFLKKSGINFKEHRLYEDIEWSHKIIYLANKICTSTSAKYFYRQHDSSIVALKTRKWLEDRDIAWRNTVRFVQSIPTNVGNMRDYDWSEMTDFVLFGILLLRIRTCGFYKLYYLFGKILVFEIRKKVKDYIKEGQNETDK